MRRVVNIERAKRIYLVRHGESEGNVDHRKYFEKHDSKIALTDLGVKQATQAGEYIAKLYGGMKREFHVIYSPYDRAVETKKGVLRALNSYGYGWSKQREDPRIRERRWGNLRDIKESGGDTEEHFNFFFKPEGGESYADAYDRAASFDQWLTLNAEEEDVLIVSHGEFIRCYLMYKLGWDIDTHDAAQTPWNGQVFVLERGCISHKFHLSPRTPVREKTTKIVTN